MLEVLDLEALRALGLNPRLIPHLAGLETGPAARLARVTEVLGNGRLSLQSPAGHHPGRVLPALHARLLAAGEQLAVGDWVLGQPAKEAGKGPALWAEQRVPPLNSLVRRDPEGRRQTLVSNVDSALLVMGLDHDFKLARLDRYLVLVRSCGLEAVVVLSKADLCRDVPGRIAELQDHLLHGGQVPVLALDGTQPEQVRARLAPWLGRGRSLVLLGSSGAGKSTLTNALCGQQQAQQATSPVREDDGRGRHTTTVRSLHRTLDGACIIDTPGLRGLQLDVSSEQLLHAFDDVAGLAPACRFRNCSHREEPGCAVRDALAPARLKSYQKLQREARREDMTLHERHQRLQQWKARSRAAHAHIRSKRGEEA